MIEDFQYVLLAGANAISTQKRHIALILHSRLTSFIVPADSRFEPSDQRSHSKAEFKPLNLQEQSPPLFKKKKKIPWQKKDISK